MVASCSALNSKVDRSAIHVNLEDDIQAVIDNSKDGDVIVFAKGIYRVATALKIYGKSNLTLNGNGSSIICDSLSADVISVDKSEGIALINFKATHTRPSGPLGCTGNVFLVYRSSNILIEKCDINGCGIVGVCSYETDNLNISNNIIHENKEYAILYIGPSVKITDNIIENNGNSNAIAYSYSDKNRRVWPFEELIRGNFIKKGFVSKDNIFH